MSYRNYLSLSESDRHRYEYLKREYIQAATLLSALGPLQSQLKKQLKQESGEAVVIIRRQMMSNRLGENGLRALNNKIKYYYRWCESHGL